MGSLCQWTNCQNGYHNVKLVNNMTRYAYSSPYGRLAYYMYEMDLSISFNADNGHGRYYHILLTYICTYIRKYIASNLSGKGDDHLCIRGPWARTNYKVNLFVL